MHADHRPDASSPPHPARAPSDVLIFPLRFYALAAGVALAWIFFQLGWMTAHVFNATRFLLYDPGSYLYAVSRWQAGEALYRDFAWQYGPLSLAWYRAFAAIGGNSPLTLVVASSLAFGLAWMIAARLVVRVAGWAWGGGLALAGLLPIMAASGVNTLNGPHGAIEMLLFALIAWTLSLSSSARSRSAWWLGGLAGLLQWVRFGPHAMALAALLLVLAWQRGHRGGDLRSVARDFTRDALRLLAGYALCVAPLAAWYFRVLPAAGARDMLWPTYMVSHYAATYPNRWPQISSISDGLTIWLPALLGVALMLAIMLRAFRRSEDPSGRSSTDGAAAGVMFFPLYYLISCVGLFHNDYATVGHLWLAWPGLALGALLVRSGWRVLILVAIAPALFASLASIATAARDERTWAAQPLVLPNGQSLWFRSGEAERFAKFREALGPDPSTRRLAVFLGGGGIHYFFGTQRVGRHWWFLPEFVRPWESIAVQKAILRHEMILVVDMGQQPNAPLKPGVVSLWIPLPKTMADDLLPHLKNPRHIPGVGDLVQVAP